MSQRRSGDAKAYANKAYANKAYANKAYANYDCPRFH